MFLEAPPQQLVLQGSVADIPFVNGTCSTIENFQVLIMLLRRLRRRGNFIQSVKSKRHVSRLHQFVLLGELNSNKRTDDEFLEYVGNVYLPSAPSSIVQELGSYYPSGTHLPLVFSFCSLYLVRYNRRITVQHQLSKCALPPI